MLGRRLLSLAHAHRLATRIPFSTTAPATPSRFPRKLLRFTAGTAAVAGVSSLLMSVNINHPTLLPEPLGKLAVGIEGLTRYGIAAYYILPKAIDWVIIEKYHKSRVSKAELERMRTAAYVETAEVGLRMIRALGGIFIKMGQNLCASPVLPKEALAVLRVLMDNAIPRELAETEKTFFEEFGTDIRSQFATFNEVPIATASLAQVYVGTLKDGRKVAIKVQHRDVARLFKVDMGIISVYYGLLSYLFQGLDFGFFVEELDRAFGEELDFELEGRNGKKAKKLFQKPGSTIVVPEVIDSLSSRRVLTMEFEEGVRIDNLAELKRMGLDVKKISHDLITLASQMMFVDGFVHCDPHPGNILVRPAKNPKGFELVLLDHGTYQHLSEDVRYNFAKIWISVITANASGVEEATQNFGIDKKYAKFVGFVLTFAPPTKDPLIADESFSQKEMEDLAADMFGVEDLSTPTPEMIEFTMALEKLPRSLLLVTKTNNLIRFINEQLGLPVNRFAIMGQVCLSAIRRVEEARSPGLLTTLSAYYNAAKLKLFLFLHPLLQWAFVEVYLRFAAPKMSTLIKKKQAEGLNIGLA